MRDPNADDAKILLQLESLRYTQSIDDAFAWANKHFRHQGAEPKLGVVEQAEADTAIARFSTFFETAGVLVRDGLLHADVFYDRYYVAPFWKLAVQETERQRKDTGVGAMGENFEWLARHEDAAHARIDQYHRSRDNADYE